MKGRIHSIESFGTVDGPGIRSVVFFQGCSLRCRYCHNPDTWNRTRGEEIDSKEVVQKVVRFKPYFGQLGGVTLSGGEPLLQPEFAATILKECKEKEIHTAVDTSGWVNLSSLEKVLPYTDLLLLDVKALNTADYEGLTGKSDEKFRKTLEYLKGKTQDIWIRYVVLPGINDSLRHINQLKRLIDSLGPQVKNVELLPYHRLGVIKWKQLGLRYSLESLQTPTQAQIDWINSTIKDEKVLVRR